MLALLYLIEQAREKQRVKRAQPEKSQTIPRKSHGKKDIVTLFCASSRRAGSVIDFLSALRVVPSAPLIGVTAREGRDLFLPVVAVTADMMEVLNIPISHVSVVSIAVVLPIFKDRTLAEALSKKICFTYAQKTQWPPSIWAE